MFVLVVAKEPIPGRVKTRLCPPCTPGEAAAIAEAALHDTFDAIVASQADEIVVALDGRPGQWLPEGARVVSQVGGDLGHRLAAAWATTNGPGVQIGMDTPQLCAQDLDHAMATLAADGNDAVLGPADDGGWWLIGLRAADERVFAGVPTSQPDTGARQLDRLRSLGMRVGVLPTVVDVDHFSDATAVATAVPRSRFAAEVRSVSRRCAAAGT